MDYEALVAQLFERHRSVQTAGFSGDAYKPGLEAMESYAAFLGHPERKFRSVHVAGTNGKGSVCSMLAAALAGIPAPAGGLRVGLYTSPHLLDFRERMKIVEELPDSTGFREIPREAVQEFLEIFDRERLTFFEVTTGMAFKWFAEEKVEVAVIETGLGGRLDSTNIITPELSIITSIGLDHCALLGGTRAEIAAEKAGIFKPGVPALVWGRDPETQPVFEAAAERIGAPLYFAEDFDIPDMPELDLSGPCQDVNFRTVCAALDIVLQPRRQTQIVDNQPLPPTACSPNTAGTLHNRLTDRVLTLLADAGRVTGFMGRWQILRREPLTICDIGHNPPAIKENFARLAALKRPLFVVYGVMADKDVDAIAELLPTDAKYFLTAPGTPRAMSAQDLALKLKNLDCTVSGTVAQGIRDAMKQACAGSIVYIGGSTYVVSEALQFFEGL